MLFRMLRRRGICPTRFGILFTRQSSAIGHPMGPVKEQSVNLYATKMSEQGFVTLFRCEGKLAENQTSCFHPRNADKFAKHDLVLATELRPDYL
jgi:hypothetical protein